MSPEEEGPLSREFQVTINATKKIKRDMWEEASQPRRERSLDFSGEEHPGERSWGTEDFSVEQLR